MAASDSNEAFPNGMVCELHHRGVSLLLGVSEWARGVHSLALLVVGIRLLRGAAQSSAKRRRRRLVARGKRLHVSADHSKVSRARLAGLRLERLPASLCLQGEFASRRAFKPWREP